MRINIKTPIGRLEAYESALYYYRMCIAEKLSPTIGFCEYFSSILSVTEFCTFNFKREFPELWKVRPQEMNTNTGYWCSLENPEARIYMIHKAIKLVNIEIKVKDTFFLFRPFMRLYYSITK